MATEKSDFDPNQDSTTDWPPLNDARLLLHRRGLLLEQVCLINCDLYDFKH